MDDLFRFIKQNILNILIFAVAIIVLLVFINIVGFDLNVPPPKLHLTQEVTVETFVNPPPNLSDTNENIEHLDVQPAENFCRSYLGNSAELESECNNLTESNCADVNCCVYVKKGNDGKCVAGSQNGPTFDNNKIGMDSYYYLGKKY